MADIQAAAPTPVNYTGLQVSADPVGAFQKAGQIQAQTNLLNAQAGMQQAQTAMQGVQLQRAIQYPGMLKKAFENPTAANFAALSAMFPDQHQAITQGWSTLHTGQQQAEIDQASRAYSALSNNRPDVALDIAQKNLSALQNSAQDPNNPTYQKQLSDAQNVVNLIRTDPKAAQGQLGAVLSSAMGPQDFASHFSSLMTQPATIAKADAEATTAGAKAQVAPQQAQADLAQTQANVQNTIDQIQHRAAAFGLDQQRFQTETALKMQELHYKQMVPNMAPGMAEQQATAVASSQQLQQSADRAVGIASQIQAKAKDGTWANVGVAGDAQMSLQNLLGSQDAVNDLKKEYASMRASALFGVVQGGRTTDADLKQIEKGFPKDNADPQQLAAWLNAYANVQRRMAVVNDAKADWISGAGTMGRMPRDANVLGVLVPAGTSFNDFMARGLKGAQLNVTPPNAAPGTMPRYMQYGN
ncbi:hypothetical protein PIN31009_05539 [Pandoraea iniqua]|uniref:hypothetical protein n=1 Tax=Pandoraea iniqua TaxID=2508288 RepID=UPI0012425BFA|nr:hypothetical protein [Pandoraea iniqua]VVE59456.1 hypothetical protein PIN31009_05539 [Pandoraea iniqua]